MKAAAFEYVRVGSLAEAVDALAGGGWGARLLAGGQSLIPMLNLRLGAVTRLVDIGRLEELRGFTKDADTVTLGSAVRHAEIEDGVVPDPANGMMRHVARHLAYRAVRNRGTIGGSVSLADPSADWLTVLFALAATTRVRGPAGFRSIPIEELVTGPYTTALEPSDVLASITLPRLSSNARWGYYKVIRKAGEYPMTTASVVIDAGRGLVRAAVGGNDRGPALLPRTARELGAHSSWSASAEQDIRGAIRSDLAATGRDADPFKATLAETTIVRAAAMALGG